MSSPSSRLKDFLAPFLFVSFLSFIILVTLHPWYSIGLGEVSGVLLTFPCLLLEQQVCDGDLRLGDGGVTYTVRLRQAHISLSWHTFDPVQGTRAPSGSVPSCTARRQIETQPPPPPPGTVRHSSDLTLVVTCPHS